MRSDLTATEKLKRKWVREEKTVKQKEYHKHEQKTVNRDDQRRELEKIKIIMNMAKDA